MQKQNSIKRTLQKYFAILFTLSIYSLFYLSYLKIFLMQAALDFLDLIEVSFLHFFIFMSLFSYITCFSINPGQVPADFSIDNISEDYKIPLNDNHVEIDHCIGRITFCDKCKKYRPHRAHHCHNCEICVLRFDHHCIQNAKKMVFTSYFP
ncbi:unnamed protein product [Blepharisma stoltei]|uniref:Palmitoyltransferase n=1 Tax=Blepharisma stoltei TaxID=1481888 RepID=A0AAU9IPM1_9CILI|nr:unnamed protein product [Blepharisma stoltei]